MDQLILQPVRPASLPSAERVCRCFDSLCFRLLCFSNLLRSQCPKEPCWEGHVCAPGELGTSSEAQVFFATQPLLVPVPVVPLQPASQSCLSPGCIAILSSCWSGLGSLSMLCRGDLFLFSLPCPFGGGPVRAAGSCDFWAFPRIERLNSDEAACGLPLPSPSYLSRSPLGSGLSSCISPW